MKTIDLSLLPQHTRELIESFQTELPVKVGRIAAELGISVRLSTLPANISGEIKEDDAGNVVIKVNRHDVKARQRFTIAHEISHYLLHRSLLKSGITDEVLYRSSDIDEVEKEANALAASIIMPTSAIKFLEQQFSDYKGEALYEKIADKLQVSTIALKIAIGKK